MRSRIDLAVSRYWKGKGSTAVRIAMGRAGGDCGVDLEEGWSYLLYLRRVRPDLFATNMCMRPRRIEDAAEDLGILPMLATQEGRR